MNENQEIHICDRCGCVIDTDDYYLVDEDILCEDCADEHCCRCDHCNDLIYTNDCVSDEDTTLCEHCYDSYYQKFAKISHHYNGKEVMLFLDECHCLAEDAVFSTYPQQVVQFLRRNLDKTTRIYITATPEAVLPSIWELESTSTSNLYPLTADHLNEFLRFTPTKSSTRLQMTYLMESDWSYLTFKTYDPDHAAALVEYLKTAAQNGKKSLIYINDIQKGQEMQELLGDSQHIYSDEDKRAELVEITANYRFESTALVMTKIAENGVSEDLSVLKTALKAACNETKAYPKELRSNIQIETVNEILRFASISEKLLPERKVYDIYDNEIVL